MLVIEAKRRPVVLRDYLRELLRRRHFIAYYARSTLQARYATSVLGSAWQVLTPLLLALTYFLLISVVRTGAGDPGQQLALIVSGLFVYYFTLNSVVLGGRAVSTGARLVMNTTFPRLALPLAEVTVAWRQLLATLPIYVVLHLVVGREVQWSLVLLVPLIGLQILLNVGLAALVATAIVYLPDVGNALPYVMRMWMYTSPVLYAATLLPEWAERLLFLNPIGPLFALLQQVLDGHTGDGSLWLATSVWSVLFLVVGASVFVRRESEFADVL